jgi:hypothetical protein
MRRDVDPRERDEPERDRDRSETGDLSALPQPGLRRRTMPSQSSANPTIPAPMIRPITARPERANEIASVRT